MIVCNSLALKLAKITRDTPDPPGGVIVRDATGEPTGVLKDAAMDAIYGRAARRGRRRSCREALRAAMKHAASVGVTSVQDLPGRPAATSTPGRRCADAGELTVRVNYRPSLVALGEGARRGAPR